jgi:hypothetical protein
LALLIWTLLAWTLLTWTLLTWTLTWRLLTCALLVGALRATRTSRVRDRPRIDTAQRIASARGGGRRARSVAGALGCFRFHFADRLFQGQPLAGDFGLAQRRLHAAQLRDQGSAGPLVERTAALAGSIGVQSGNGAGDQRVVISHFLYYALDPVMSR